ncbi:MAG: glycine cleavage system aminomethyltransferase GcvT [Spirochaetales bacterium]|nr:glycine cleavage system aminomethyltransferase GcvT [Spirochaetales bacterium]
MKRTPLYENHVGLGARMVEFAGWEMPVQYPTGIVEEHLLTRSRAGLFDVSHMGRFLVSGREALHFLQKLLSNNAAALEPGRAQYTMIPNESGGALDDAYLYCLGAADGKSTRRAEPGREYLLVVNAANRERDWEHLQSRLSGFTGTELRDCSGELAMLSLQGPDSPRILSGLFGERSLPQPGRNNLLRITAEGRELIIARTGYTGEPLGFEIFPPADSVGKLWDRMIESGAAAVGLGARDTLRLEAGLPLYGHELGRSPDDEEIPIFSCPLARFAVSLSDLKGSFVGRQALEAQFAEYKRITKGDCARLQALPRMIRLFEIRDRGIARRGAEVFVEDRCVGRVTSGTMAPYWIFEAEKSEGSPGEPTGRSDRRAIGMVLIDSSVAEQSEIEIDVRGRRLRALTVSHLLRTDGSAVVRPVLWDQP